MGKRPLISGAWKYLRLGNVVMWWGHLWIVMQVQENGLRLIDFTHSNVEGGPTTTWPEDSDKNVESVEFVAECCSDYIKKCLNRIFPGIA